MAYSKHSWLPRLGTGLNKYTDQNSNVYALTPTPDSVTQEGTPFSATWMNQIEDGLEGAYLGRRAFYAVCSTAAATAAKTVTITEFTAADLAAGSIVAVKFTNGNSAASPTLNINSGGAAAIYCGSRTTLATVIAADQPAIFEYDGAGWALINPAVEFKELIRFTSSGTFTPASYPSDGGQYVVVILGGGGAGGLGENAGYKGGGGGAGAMMMIDFVHDATAFSSYTVVVGAASGTSSFYGWSAPGGAAGGQGAASAYGSGGAGGSVAGFTGNAGVQRGAGASSEYGVGGAAGTTTTNGQPGGYGAGGGGGMSLTGHTPGGAGGTGLVIVYGYQ